MAGVSAGVGTRRAGPRFVRAPCRRHVGWLRGGFLGVDMFFVLSGYLTATLLLREFEASSRISLPRFWARRARRLYPAVLRSAAGSPPVIVARAARAGVRFAHG